MNRNVLLGFILLLSLNAFGQETIGKSTVKFDPLFWKDDLNLKADQRTRIREINSKFYEEIQHEFQDSQDDLATLKVKVDKSLEARSQEIWDTLYPRQRKKWEKLMRQYEENQI